MEEMWSFIFLCKQVDPSRWGNFVDADDELLLLKWWYGLGGFTVETRGLLHAMIVKLIKREAINIVCIGILEL